MKEWEQDDWKMKETERKGIKEGIDEVWKKWKEDKYRNTDETKKKKEKRKGKERKC